MARWGLIIILAVLVLTTVQPSARAQDPGPEPDHEVRTLGRERILQVSWVPTGDLLAVSSTRISIFSTVMRFRIYTDQLEVVARFDVPLPTSGLHQMVWSPDGNQLAISVEDALWIWNRASDNLINYLPGTDEYFWFRRLALAWSPDSTKLAVAHYTQSWFILNPATGEILFTYEGELDRFYEIAGLYWGVSNRIVIVTEFWLGAFLGA